MGPKHSFRGMRLNTAVCLAITSFLTISLLLILSGCAHKSSNWAPVQDRRWKPHHAQKLISTCTLSDHPTSDIPILDKSALKSQSSNQLIQHHWDLTDHLEHPIRQGNHAIRSNRQAITQSIPQHVAATKSKKGWIWPATGQVLTPFSIKQGKKGIDIAGKKGGKIYAVADGKVVYAGHGLASYGNLLIIKHQQNFLTAYGNNLKNLVVEGQHIKAGQIIADMGLISPGVWGLHFEIRKQGNPVNPIKYLVQ